MEAAVIGIKDYVNMAKVSITPEEKEKKERAAREYIKPTIDVEYQDIVDYVLVRKTKRTTTRLMVLMSQGKVCIAKGNEVVDANHDGINKFFTGYMSDDFGLQKCKWHKRTNRNEICGIVDALSDEVISETLVQLCRYGIIQFSFSRSGWSSSYHNMREIVIAFKPIMSLAKQLAKTGKTYQISDIHAQINMNSQLAKFGGSDLANYFNEKFADSSLASFHNPSVRSYYYNIDANKGIIQQTMEMANVDGRRFVDYLLFDIPAQGLSLTSDLYRTIFDYYNMQKQLYGKVKEKYSDHLRTDHDIVAMKHRLNKEIIQSRCFHNVSEKATDYEYEDGNYCIVVPKESSELVEEGVALNHCVASYIDKMANGGCVIVFLRLKETPDVSYYTIEVVGNRIVQVRGIHNCSMPGDSPERKFLEKWAIKKGLEI